MLLRLCTLVTERFVLCLGVTSRDPGSRQRLFLAANSMRKNKVSVQRAVVFWSKDHLPMHWKINRTSRTEMQSHHLRQDPR